MQLTSLQGNAAVTDNNVFIYPKDKELTSEDLKSFIDYNDGTPAKTYQDNLNMYRGDYPILHQENKPLNKPDHRIVINFAKYIVDIYNGFFIGIPPQFTSQDTKVNDNVQAFVNSNAFGDKLNEVAKKTSIYGHCYLFLYQDELSQTRVAISDPENSFIIYDDTVAQQPLYFVRYLKKGLSEVTGEAYSTDKRFTFNSSYSLTEDGANLFKAVPAIEFVENDERQGAFESVKSIMNDINSALSAKSNDVDAIADAYMFLKGGDVDLDDDTTLNHLKDDRLININDPEADAKFLERPNGDGTQENLLNRLEDYLFLTAMVSNLNDINGSNATTASGYSIELRMQAMRGLASNKERKFTIAIKQLLKLVFGVQEVRAQSIFQKAVTAITGIKNDDPLGKLEIKFTRNLPKNVADEANTVKTLEGLLSKETQLKAIPSLVTDPKTEIKQMQQEDNDKVNNAVNNSQANYNFDDGGINDAKNNTEK